MPNTQHRLSHRLGLLAVAVTAALFAWRPAHAQPDQPSSVFGDPILITRAMDGAHSVAAADFDADGDLDVAAVSRLDGQVRWFRNLAETVVPGTSPQLDSRAIDILDGAYALYPADLDNDGDVDLTVAAVTDVAPSATAAGVARDPVGRIVWYENDGGAVPVFARHDVFTTLNYPVSVHAADLDNDGDMDLMSASRDDSKVMWYENDGAPNPSFVPHLLTDRYDGAVSVHAGDLNGDGRQDVVFAAENSDTVAWFANQGGTPATFELHILQTLGGSLPPTQDYAKAVVVADLDGDGDNDVGYVSESQNLLNWYENDGGTMPTFTLHPISDRVLHAKAVYAADVDGDGDTDLLTASTSDQTFALFENDGSDRPEFARRDLITDARGARSVSVADLNGDGRLDILTASRYDNRIQWLPNLSLHRTANFDPADQHVIARGRVGPLVAADVDGDGDQDAATVMDDRLLWYVNDGARAPGFQPSVIVDGLSGVAPADAGDIDGDGDTDLLTVGTGAHALAWYEQGSGGAAAWSRHPLLTTGSARDAFIYDVDRDGDRDIVAALDDRLIWLRHDPTGAVRFEELLIDAARAPDRLLGVAAPWTCRMLYTSVNRQSYCSC